MQRLKVYQPDGTVYEVLGRDKNPTPASVHFAKSSEIITIDGFLEKEVYLLIRLENGLIDIPKILQWLDELSAPIQSINFTQTTSRLIDSFIACRLIWSDSVGPAFVDLQ